MSIGFWGCVLWAIVETVVKADNYPVRFNVAMALIGVDVIGFLWLFGVRFVQYVAGDNEVGSTTAGERRTERPVTGTPLAPPWMVVEVQVDDPVHEVDTCECLCDGSHGTLASQPEDGLRSRPNNEHQSWV
jgi:hypothetical protein